MQPIGKILVPLAGAALDDQVLDEAETIARTSGAEIILMSVAHYHTRDSRPVAVRQARATVESARLRLLDEGLEMRAVVGHGEIADAIVEEADRFTVDLIVMGVHGHGAMRRLLEASIPDRVRHRCRIPIVLVRTSSRVRTAA